MSYKIILTENAVEGILRLRKAGERQALKKIDRLLSELEEHPETGTGKPERLKGELSGKWSRRITERHRLVYEIFDEYVEVVVLSACGPYDDK